MMKYVRIAFNALVFAAGMCCFAGKFRPNWELGRYYMPRLAVAADGWHHLNGEPLDGLSLAIVQSGRQEELALALLAAALAFVGWDCWRRLNKPQPLN